MLPSTDSIDPLLELLGAKYFKYADVCYFTYTSLDKTTSSIGNKTTGSEKNDLHSGHDGSEDRFVASLENDLTVQAKTTEMKITDFSSGSYTTVFRDVETRYGGG